MNLYPSWAVPAAKAIPGMEETSPQGKKKSLTPSAWYLGTQNPISIPGKCSPRIQHLSLDEATLSKLIFNRKLLFLVNAFSMESVCFS